MLPCQCKLRCSGDLTSAFARGTTLMRMSMMHRTSLKCLQTSEDLDVAMSSEAVWWGLLLIGKPNWGGRIVDMRLIVPGCGRDVI